MQSLDTENTPAVVTGCFRLCYFLWLQKLVCLCSLLLRFSGIALSPYDDEIVPDESLWDNVGMPVNFSPDTLRRAGVPNEAITCLYEFLFGAGEKMDLEDENLDGQITLERR